MLDYPRHAWRFAWSVWTAAGANAMIVTPVVSCLGALLGVTIMPIFVGILVAAAVLLALTSWRTDGIAGAVMIGTACLCGILARILQARHLYDTAHQHELQQERRLDALLRELLGAAHDPQQPTP